MSELRRITERYRLDKLVVSTDAGSVFRGTDNQSGETVAVKLINSGTGGESEEQREQFLATARALQALHHPSIPKVLDFGFTTAGSAFLVTEYLPGTSFEEFAGSAPVRVLSLLLLVVDGLEALARHGISCRNLAAENLLVVPGAEGEQVKILGWGSVALRSEAAPGTDGYRDGLRAFALLTCRMLRVSTDEVGVPLEVAIELEDTEALRSFLHDALRGDPEERYPVYAEVRRALRLALFGQSGRKGAAKTETFSTAIGVGPGPGGRGLASTVVVREPEAGWGAPPLEEPPGAAETRPGVPPPPPPPALNGTMILSTVPAGRPEPAPPRDGDGSENRTRIIRPSEGTYQIPMSDTLRGLPAEPLSESRMGGTVRVQLPADSPDLATRVFVPPVPVEAPAPSRTASGTMEITAASLTPLPPTLPGRPAPVRETGTMETPMAAAFEPPPPVQPAVPPPIAPTLVAVPPPPPLLPPLPVQAAVPEPQWTPPPPPPPMPEPVAASPAAAVEEPPARPTAPAATPPKAKKPGNLTKLLLGVGVPTAAALLAGVLFLVFREKEPEAPPPPPKPVVKPAPPVQPAPAAAPVLPVHPQIELAETHLGAGDLAGARTAVEAITAEEQAAFRPDELERYQRLQDVLTPLKREELAGNLARGLEIGDLRLLRSAVASAPTASELPPDVQKNLSAARRAIDADSKLARAQRSGNHAEIIRQAHALLQQLPRATRVAEQRERAAAALEREADEAAGTGQFDLALGRLEVLRQVWPERAGLEERAERVRAERKEDQDLEAVLASVTRAERANKPTEALEILSRTRPNRRFEDRFRQARERLEAQFAQLDRQAPVLTARSGEITYKKGKPFRIALRITDDFGVKSMEGWARIEGGQYVKVPVQQISGSDYEIEISPSLHQNKPVEYYVTASDQSGHTGQLGSADSPLKVKRKGLFDRLRGGKGDEGEEEDP